MSCQLNTMLFAFIVLASVLCVHSRPEDEEKEGVSVGLELNAGSTIPGGEPPSVKHDSMAKENVTQSVTVPTGVTNSSTNATAPSDADQNTTSAAAPEESPKLNATNIDSAAGNGSATTESTSTTQSHSSSTRLFAATLLLVLPVLTV